MKYKDISNNKLELMAIAMFLIMFFHSQVPVSNEIIYFIRRYGFIGVDLFLFFSGIGCLYSYRKNKNKKQFFKKRILRTLPYYIPVTIIMCFVLLKFGYINSFDFFGEITLTNFFLWVGHFPKWYWYIPSLLILYLITPFVIDFYDKHENKKKICLLISLVTFLIMLIGLAPNDQRHYVFIGRIPIYLIGLLFGQLSYEDKSMKKRYISLYIVGMIASFFILNKLLYLPVKWYTYFFIYLILIIDTIGLSISISYILNWSKDHFKLFKFKFLKLVGGITLEIYAIHERLIIIGHFLLKKIGYNISLYNTKYNIVIAILTIFMAYLLNKIIKWLIDINPIKNKITTKKSKVIRQS